MANLFEEFSTISKLNIFYTGCKASEDFSEKKMLVLLKGILRANKKEQIIIGIYHSIHCWIKTVVALNHTMHIQAVASATRSVYEQLLDLKLIVDNKIDHIVERFEAFREIEKFRMEKKLSDFKKTYPDFKTAPHALRIQYASDPNNQAKIKKLKKELFVDSDGRAEHWSGLKIEQRAKLAGVEYEQFYNESFVILSWYVHSGQVGNTTKEFLELVYGDSMRLVHEMFVDAALLTARGLKLNIAVQEFQDWIQELSLIPGFAILEEEKKHLKAQEKTKNKGVLASNTEESE